MRCWGLVAAALGDFITSVLPPETVLALGTSVRIAVGATDDDDAKTDAL